MYNLLFGGAAGLGVDTTSALFENLMKKAGYNVFTSKDFMSRIRGGHNFSRVRFGTEVLLTHSSRLDGIVAMDDETVAVHRGELDEMGFILCDTSLKTDDPRAIKIDMAGMAEALGNPRVAGSIAIGVLLRLFGENMDDVPPLLKQVFREDLVEINQKAIARGFDSVKSKYTHLPGKYSDWMLLSGNKALCLGAIAAGLKFYSAYPMSPSTTIMDYLASKSEIASIVVEQAEDEIAAINMAIGASFAGARAMTGTSGGGFSLMVEALGLSGMAEIPLVIAECQRPGPTTGLPTRTEQSDLRFVISASQGEFPRMVIALRHHTDAFYQTFRAFALAEKYQIPVILLTDQFLCDATATVCPFDLERLSSAESTTESSKKSTAKSAKESIAKTAADAKGTEEYLRYRFTPNGISPRLIPGKFRHFVAIDSDEHDERGWITESAEMRIQMMDKRMRKLEELKKEVQEPEFIGSPSFETLFVGWGSTYGSIAEAVDLLNKKDKGRYAALVFGDLYPFPSALLIEKAAAAKSIVNIEQNATGQLAGLIREHTGIQCTSSILKYDGRQITGEDIVARFLEKGSVTV